MQANSLTRLSGRTKQSTSRQRGFIKDNIVRTTMKKCSRCKIFNELSEFNRDSRSKDGLHCYCKSCRHELRGTIQKKRVDKVAFKVCSKCKLLLPSRNFSIDSRAMTGLRSDCTKCRNNTRTDNNFSIKERHNSCMISVKLNYGLSEYELQEMLLAQQGCCEICGIDFGTVETSIHRAYCIDHNHFTNTVRGLLCYKCNKNVSLVELNKSTENKTAYKKYLNKYSLSLA